MYDFPFFVTFCYFKAALIIVDLFCTPQTVSGKECVLECRIEAAQRDGSSFCWNLKRLARTKLFF